MKIGVDIGGSHIGIGVIDNNANIIDKKEIRILKEDKQNIKEFIEDFLINSIEEITKKYKIEVIGISSPGRIKEGTIIRACNLGLYNYNIIQNIKNKIDNCKYIKNKDIEYQIKNDAQCAAIAEKEYGSLKEVSDGMFLTIGTGIGGAVFRNNQILKFEGKSHFSLGHLTLKKDGVKCNCGKIGCFEKYAGMKAFKDKLRERLQLDKTTSGKDIINIINLNSNNKIILDTIDEYVEDLTDGIKILLEEFNINTISLGGGFVYYKDILLDKIKNKIF